MSMPCRGATDERVERSVARAQGLLHQLVDMTQPDEHRGPGAQHVAAVDLVDAPVPHRADAIPAGPSADDVEIGRLAAPGHEDDLRVAAGYLRRVHHPIACAAAVAQVVEDV